MKIGDIEVGVEYAISDTKQGRGRRSYTPRNPRQAKVLEIIVKTEEYWSGDWSSVKKIRNVRMVRVEITDDQTPTDSYYSGPIEKATKGQALTIKADNVVAPWVEVRDDIKKRIETENEARALQAKLEARVKAIFPELGDDLYSDNNGDVTISVSAQNLERTSIQFRDLVLVEKLLAMLEGPFA